MRMLRSQRELECAQRRNAGVRMVLATLRLRGVPGRDGCQSALWDCFGDEFAAMLKMRPEKQSHNSFDNRVVPVSRATSKWRVQT